MSEKAHDIRKLTIPSSMQMVERAEEMTEAVLKQAGLSDEEEDCVCLAVMEAVINAIVHGNHQDPAKQVDLEFDVCEGIIAVTVRDQGEGFNPATLPDPRAPENLLKSSGRGILMIRACMDEVEIRPCGGRGTEVRMVKRTCHP
ncbi:MAG: ATP-binding protein [Candidatus Latescibacteria bacterium]|nr:ATP-binding protein [Candidatus Latescibacterota bacterium]